MFVTASMQRTDWLCVHVMMTTRHFTYKKTGSVKITLFGHFMEGEGVYKNIFVHLCKCLKLSHLFLLFSLFLLVSIFCLMVKTETTLNFPVRNNKVFLLVLTSYQINKYVCIHFSTHFKGFNR